MKNTYPQKILKEIWKDNLILDSGLEFITNKDLHQNLKNLVGSERKILSVILDHLTEIYKRRMYAELGFSSLFKYCTHALGYSDSAALRRRKIQITY